MVYLSNWVVNSIALFIRALTTCRTLLGLNSTSLGILTLRLRVGSSRMTLLLVVHVRLLNLQCRPRCVATVTVYGLRM